MKLGNARLFYFIYCCFLFVFYNVFVSNYWGNLWVESLDTVVQHSGEKLNVPRAGPLPTAF